MPTGWASPPPAFSSSRSPAERIRPCRWDRGMRRNVGFSRDTRSLRRSKSTTRTQIKFSVEPSGSSPQSPLRQAVTVSFRRMVRQPAGALRNSGLMPLPVRAGPIGFEFRAAEFRDRSPELGVADRARKRIGQREFRNPSWSWFYPSRRPALAGARGTRTRHVRLYLREAARYHGGRDQA